MKKLFTIFLFCSFNSFGQINATTEEGKKVKLHSNKTWEYVNQPKENTINEDCNSAIWEAVYYIDNFQQPTDNGYIRNESYIYGKFSNSATTNSNLKVRLLIDDYSFSMMLYEYNEIQVKDVTDTRYSLSINHKSLNKKYEFTNFTSKGDRVTIRKSKSKRENRYEEIIEVLKTGGNINIYLKNISQYGGGADYLFSLNTDCFDEHYTELLK